MLRNINNMNFLNYHTFVLSITLICFITNRFKNEDDVFNKRYNDFVIITIIPAILYSLKYFFYTEQATFKTTIISKTSNSEPKLLSEAYPSSPISLSGSFVF